MVFVDSRSFKISNVADGSVLEVKKQRTNDGASVITWEWNAHDHQIWHALAEGAGFRLSATHTGGDLKSLDQGANSSSVMIWGFHGGDNQIWNAFEVVHAPGTFHIQNMGSHTFLRNMGQGRRAECVQFAHDDFNMHWVITEL